MTLLSARDEIGRRDLETLRNGFGQMLCARLDDPNVTDVLLNGDGSLFEDRRDVGMTQIGRMDDHDATSIINLVASMAGEIVNRKNPVFEGELSIRGARFIAFVPPIVPRPSFAIRLPSPGIWTLQDYVDNSIMTYKQCEVIEDAIYRERNITVTGGTGSGKTTLLNAVFEAVNRIWPKKRIGLIEEIVELQFRQSNVLALRTGTGLDHQELMRRLMRCRPDILAFGEVRDKAALQLMKATNTGHGSVITTMHCNSPRSAPQRMHDMCAEALPGVDLRRQIADAFGIIVGIERVDPDLRKPGEPDRRITEIVSVDGVDDDNDYIFTPLA